MWLFMDGGGCDEVLLARRPFRQVLAPCPLPGGGKAIIFNTVSTNLKMSKHYRRLNLQLSHRCSKECIEGWPFSSSPGFTNNTWVQSRGHCKRQHYSSRKPNQVLLKTSDSILNVIYALKIIFWAGTMTQTSTQHKLLQIQLGCLVSLSWKVLFHGVFI